MREALAGLGRIGLFGVRVLASLAPQRGSFSDLWRQL